MCHRAAAGTGSQELPAIAIREACGFRRSRAVECLVKDREALLAFYDFPAEHWIHIRTTNPIESTFATIRQRTERTKPRAASPATGCSR